MHTKFMSCLIIATLALSLAAPKPAEAFFGKKETNSVKPLKIPKVKKINVKEIPKVKKINVKEIPKLNTGEKKGGGITSLFSKAKGGFGKAKGSVSAAIGAGKTVSNFIKKPGKTAAGLARSTKIGQKVVTGLNTAKAIGGVVGVGGKAGGAPKTAGNIGKDLGVRGNIGFNIGGKTGSGKAGGTPKNVERIASQSPAQVLGDTTALVGATGVGAAATSAAPPVIPSALAENTEQQAQVTAAFSSRARGGPGGHVVCVFNCDEWENTPIGRRNSEVQAQ